MGDAKTFVVRIYPGKGPALRIVGVVELIPGGTTRSFSGFNELRRILLTTLPPAGRSGRRATAVVPASRTRRRSAEERSD